MTVRDVVQVADALAALSVVSNATERERQEAHRGMLRLARQLEAQRGKLTKRCDVFCVRRGSSERRD